ncbi:MAG: hypothetical protein IIA88_09415, partial [Bacteroidetes bacterium]|nr:hypothetical protein [Bacteroidota bacterium]
MENLFKNFSKAALLLLFVIFAASCKKEKEKEPQPTPGNIMPAKMSVNVPNSISSSTPGTGRLSGSHCPPKGDSIQGCEIYEQLRLFIEIGNNSGKIVEFLMTAIRQNNINKAMTFQLTGDDGRTKDYEVVANPVDNTGKTWEFKLEVEDSVNTALQLWWNINPVEGLVILNLYHIDRVDNPDAVNMMYQIEYSEDKVITGYDARMIVTITGITEPNPNSWSVDNFRMGVGINGKIVDVWGNSNHPNAFLIDSTTIPRGRNYAFVARGDTALDIGVAELAIVPSTEPTNTTILTDFAIYNVLWN